VPLPSQDKLGGLEGCGRKGIRRKMVRMAEVEASISLYGVASIRIVGASAFAPENSQDLERGCAKRLSGT